MNKPNQREGSSSNSSVGREFELSTQAFFHSEGLILDLGVKISIGINSLKKEHSFDLGCLSKNVIVECKSHKWTKGNNVPSAKMTVWNEAMYYFLLAPKEFRKIMFVLRDFSEKRDESLAEYYLRRYGHLIPEDVEFWEYDEEIGTAIKLQLSKFF